MAEKATTVEAWVEITWIEHAAERQAGMVESGPVSDYPVLEAWVEAKACTVKKIKKPKDGEKKAPTLPGQDKMEDGKGAMTVTK